MLYRPNPKNGDMLSQLGFGCMRLPRKGVSIDLARSADLIHAAIEQGVNYFDTAYIYPGSEAALGRALAGGWRERVNLATKMPVYLIRSPADFPKFFGQQLDRLGTERIDYYLLHMLTSLEQYEGLRALGVEAWAQAEKKRGRIRSLGFSFHGSRDSFRRIVDAYPWDFCMIQYNYLDEEYQAGAAGLRYAHAKGLPVIVMEPLRGGKLAAGLPGSVLRAFRQAREDRSPADWGLRWVLNHPEVTTVLSGMNSRQQVDENIRTASDASADSLSETELAALGKAASILKAGIKVNCTGCGYCLPCPAGVDIPHCLSRYNDSMTYSRLRNRSHYMMAAGVIPAKPSYASQCRRCGRCERHCPQGIGIMDALADAAEYLEPFWMKPAARIVRRFTAGGRK